MAVTRTPKVALPFSFGAGVKVRVPVEEIAGWTEKSAVLLLVREKVRV